LRKLLFVIVLVASALPLAAAQASSTRTRFAPTPYAGQCGLPVAQPIWMEFGWPTPQFNAIMGKHGVVVGASSGAYPAQMRAAGAATVYFDLNLNKRIGTTTAPADPTTIQAKAQKFYDFAVQQIGCPNPVIVMNELSGASLVTPWSDENAQYRANALAFVQALSQLGAYPVLLVPVSPYTGGDAAAWWQQAAQYAEIVREVYVPATLVWADGAVFGNRVLRQAYRQGIEDFTSIGIPPNKLGLMVSFATTKGFGGRNGLQPATAWYQVAKWQALAAKQVAAETGIASIWSWGWGEWTTAEQDPAKPYALCAWLWTRSAKLCDAPKAIGRKRFDTSRREGQLSLLSPGTQCLVGRRALSQAAISQLQLVTGDREEAYSALFERLVESAQTSVSPQQVLAAERAVVAQEFHGSGAAYHAALARAHASVTVARGVLGDELRRAQVQRGLYAPPASGSEVSTFYSSYPDLQVRLVSAKPAPVWLGRRSQGFALSQVAPDVLFALATGRSATIRTSEGKFTVKPLASPLPLGAVPLGQAGPAIAAALRSFARGAAFERWTVARQGGALDQTLCQHDDLPQPAAVDLASYLPFLRLG
jgi:hypothetical protein